MLIWTIFLFRKKTFFEISSWLIHSIQIKTHLHIHTDHHFEIFARPYTKGMNMWATHNIRELQYWNLEIGFQIIKLNSLSPWCRPPKLASRISSAFRQTDMVSEQWLNLEFTTHIWQFTRTHMLSRWWHSIWGTVLLKWEVQVARWKSRESFPTERNDADNMNLNLRDGKKEPRHLSGNRFSEMGS